MKKQLWAIGVAFSLITGTPGLINGQSTRADSIIDFAETMLTDRFRDGRPVLRIAQLPPSMSDIPLPLGTEVFGSLDYHGASVVILRAENPVAVVSRMRSTLEKDGWTYRPHPVRPGFATLRAATLLCTYEQSLALGTVENGDIVVMHARGDHRDGRCSEAPDEDPETLYRSPIPGMLPPPGTDGVETASYGGRDYWHSFIRLRGEMAVQDIMSHYEGELVQAGARIGETIEAGGVSSTSFELTDSQGLRLRGAITTVEITQEHRTVHVEVVR
jgi:hypothetical protein